MGYHTPAEVKPLNNIYALLRLPTNFFSPQQKPLEKHRRSAKVTKGYDTAESHYQRVLADKRATKQIKTSLGKQYKQLNLAQIRRDITALQDQLLMLVQARHPPTRLSIKHQLPRGRPFVRQRTPARGHPDVRQHGGPTPPV